ncbi:MAG TPA: hypothetical protein VK837_03600 [Longimicrobiales bacterium]|nr:hypothetical protein [Longimicrobiales bacterium]
MDEGAMEAGSKELAEELRRLYWESTLSVRKIRDRLDLTSNALYELLEPFPADTACPVCGGAVGYRNRTTRTNHLGTCLTCGETVRVAEADAAEPTDAAGKEGDTADKGSRERVDHDWVADAVDDALASTERVVRDVAVAAVGLVAVLAVGVVGFFGWRRRG